MTTAKSPALTADTATWQLDSFEDYRYIDSELSGLRRTQGITWNADASEWITTWQFGMARETEDFEFLQTTGSIDLSNLEITTGIPKVLADMGFDHIGDIDYYNGKLYVSLDSEAADYQNGHVAIFNANDLSYTGTLFELVGDPTNEHDDVASWVAVDGENGLGYGKEWQNGNTINVYNLDDWSFQGTLEMDQSLKNIQGAKVLDGKMYMSAHGDTKSVYTVDLDTGHVEKLFDMPKGANAFNETEGLEVRKLENGDIEIFVQLIIDPNGDEYADAYVRMFHYVLSAETGGTVSLAHTWTVNSTSDESDSDDWALTLREAIAKAADGDTITFDTAMSGATITLADAELALSKNITIEGDLDADGKSDITIDGTALSDVFHVTGGTAILDGLLVLHGEEGSAVSVDDGAALYFTNGATSDQQTDGDDVLTGASGFDAIYGDEGDDIILGLGGDDRLYGDAGNDILVGGSGDDTMVGGEGDDTYVVSDLGDVVTELDLGGTDLVKSSVSYTLSAFVENLNLSGADDIDGTGNDLANLINGNSGINELFGLGGNDTLKGGKGADILDGGEGKDMLYGGLGRDVLTGGAGADRFIFATSDSATPIENADYIVDFQGKSGDRIDLRLIDANEGKGGDQKFHFIGTDRFTGHDGDLRFEKVDGHTYIYGDTDGDKQADFMLDLEGAMSLKADFFLL